MKTLLITITAILLTAGTTYAATAYFTTVNIDSVTVFSNEYLAEQNYKLVKITDPQNGTDCYITNLKFADTVAMSCYPKRESTNSRPTYVVPVDLKSTSKIQ